jgi:Rieske Fe-S protein
MNEFHAMSQSSSEFHLHPSEEPRRGFLTHFFAAGIGLLVGAVPVVSGLAFFLDPLLRKKAGGSGDGFLKMPIALDALEINGEPQLVKIEMGRVDAWNTYRNQPVGAVYLRRTGTDKVVAFNSRCPHLGCAVDYKPAEKIYYCPCHTSAFELSGKMINDIPPRPLDELEVNIRNSTEVWVKFQNFRATTPDKIPVG